MRSGLVPAQQSRTDGVFGDRENLHLRFSFSSSAASLCSISLPLLIDALYPAIRCAQSQHCTSSHPKRYLHASHCRGHWAMSRFLLLSLLTTAAWILIRAGKPSTRVIPAKEAAAKLQQAWADHHTTA